MGTSEPEFILETEASVLHSPVPLEGFAISENNVVLIHFILADPGVLLRFTVQNKGARPFTLEIEVETMHAPRFQGKAILIEEETERCYLKVRFFFEFPADSFGDSLTVIYLSPWQTPTSFTLHTIGTSEQEDAVSLINEY